jgi:hypothetical protein
LGSGMGPPAERKLLLVAFVFSNSCGGNFGHSHGDIMTYALHMHAYFAVIYAQYLL